MELPIIEFLETALNGSQSATISAHLASLRRSELNNNIDVTC